MVVHTFIYLYAAPVVSLLLQAHYGPSKFSLVYFLWVIQVMTDEYKYTTVYLWSLQLLCGQQYD